MSRLRNFDGIDSFEVKAKNKEESVPTATENERRKLAPPVKFNLTESNFYGLKHKLDSDKERVSADKGILNKRDLSRDVGKDGDLVQSGIALENPKYGNGEGKQYFISDAARKSIKRSEKIPLRNGYLDKVGETHLRYDGPLYLSESKKESEKQKIKPAISVDSSPLSKSERVELQQLDKNTMDARGLPKVMKNKEEQIAEYWKHAHSNQESRGTDINPDAWSNPRNLKEGEKFYQIRPSNQEDASDYFTDAETVNRCRKGDGSVSVEKLLQALQIAPGENRDWTLREYIYRKI